MNEDAHETAAAEELRGGSRSPSPSRPVADVSRVTMEQQQAYVAAQQAAGAAQARSYDPIYDPWQYRLDPNSPIIAAPLAAPVTGHEPGGD